MTEHLTEIGMEGIDQDIFDRHLKVVVAILAASSLGVANMPKSSCAIACAPKAILINENLHQIAGIAVLGLPIRVQTPQYPGEAVAGEMGHTHMGGYQKSGVIGRNM